MTRPGRETAGGMSTVAEAPPWEGERGDRPTWGLAEGDAIAPGRTVIRTLGGGTQFEVFLVWDERLHALTVAKALRPDRFDASGRCASSRWRRSCSAGSRTPSCAASTPRSTASARTCSWSISRATRCGADPPLRRAAARAAAAARDPRGGGAALPGRRGHGPPRRQAGQHRHGRPAAADRLCRRAQGRRARPARPARSGPTPTCRPSSADPSRATIGPAADILGLGATLHHAVAGERPFPRPRGAATAPTRRCDSRSSPPPPGPLPRRLRRRSVELLAACSPRIPATGRRPPRSPPRWSRSSPTCRGGSCWAAAAGAPRADRAQLVWCTSWRP